MLNSPVSIGAMITYLIGNLARPRNIGRTMTHAREDCRQGHRLVLTRAAPEDAANPARDSRGTFALEPIEEMTRLTVTQFVAFDAAGIRHIIGRGEIRQLA